MKLLVFIGLAFTLSCSSGRDAVIYVAPDGDDANSGSIDKPLATLFEARSRIRTIKESEDHPESGITVYVRGGEYFHDKTLVFGPEDSGSADDPVIVRSYPDETATFTGGRKLNDFQTVTDLAVMERLSEEARKHVVMADLKALGVTGYENINPMEGTTMHLFFNNEFMTLAQYPDEGDWLTVTEVPLDKNNRIEGDPRSRDAEGNTWGQHSGQLKFDDETPRSWSPLAADNLILHGYWYWDWRDGFQEMERIDAENGIIYLKEPYHFYGYRAGQRFYFRNVLEALDSPGEWYVDRANGILYFWPPAAVTDDNVMVSIAEYPAIKLENTDFMTLRGFRFEGFRNAAVIISGGSNNLIAECTMLNTGATPVSVSGGTKNGVTGCDIFQVASGCIGIFGGDRETLTPGYNYADNNHLHHYNRVNRIGPALSLYGVGNTLSHNKIHDAPHAGVWFQGNDNILEYNEVYDIALETGDVGGFYIGRDYTCRGNIIRYNYFHHIHGPGEFGAMPVYLDDFTSATTIYGNVFFDTSRAILVGGGRDNTIENNIFVKCSPSVQVDARGLTWATKYFNTEHPNYDRHLLDHMEAMNYTKPPYSEKYPELLTLFDDDPAVPRNNVVRRNISWGSEFLYLNDGIDIDLVAVKDNIIADEIIVSHHNRGEDAKVYHYHKEFTADDKKMIGRLTSTGNTIMNGNPGFTDIDKEDFSFLDDSPASKIGFEAIPFGKIGLYKGEYRQELE